MLPSQKQSELLYFGRGADVNRHGNDRKADGLFQAQLAKRRSLWIVVGRDTLLISSAGSLAFLEHVDVLPYLAAGAAAVFLVRSSSTETTRY